MKDNNTAFPPPTNDDEMGGGLCYNIGIQSWNTNDLKKTFPLSGI